MSKQMTSPACARTCTCALCAWVSAVSVRRRCMTSARYSRVHVGEELESVGEDFGEQHRDELPARGAQLGLYVL